MGWNCFVVRVFVCCNSFIDILWICLLLGRPWCSLIQCTLFITPQTLTARLMKNAWTKEHFKYFLKVTLRNQIYYYGHKISHLQVYQVIYSCLWSWKYKMLSFKLSDLCRISPISHQFACWIGHFLIFECWCLSTTAATCFSHRHGEHKTK